MKKRIMSYILITILSVQFLGGLFYPPVLAHAVDASNDSYSIATPVVKASLIGNTQNSVRVLVNWEMPNEAALDAYGFLVCKKSSKPGNSADQHQDCPESTSLVTTIYPTPIGFDDLTNAGVYYDGAVVEGETYNYYVVAFDRSGVISNPGNASTTIEFNFFTNIKISNITNNSATITWDTDAPSDCTIDYGQDANYGQTANATAINDDKTSFKVDLSSLKNDITYHFRLNAKVNEDGSNEKSSDKTFFTKIFEITNLNISRLSNNIPIPVKVSWNTTSSATCSFNNSAVSSSGTDHSTTLSLMPCEDGAFTIDCTSTDDTKRTATANGKAIQSSPPPSISNNKVDIAPDNKVTVSWTSDVAVIGRIKYFKKDSQDFKYANYSGLNPSVILSELSANKDYSYYVIPNTITDSHSCSSTSGGFHTPCPILTDIKVNLDDYYKKASISWKTNLKTAGSIIYNGQTVNFTENETEVILPNLNQNTTYNYSIHLDSGCVAKTGSFVTPLYSTNIDAVVTNENEIATMNFTSTVPADADITITIDEVEAGKVTIPGYTKQASTSIKIDFSILKSTSLMYTLNLKWMSHTKDGSLIPGSGFGLPANLSGQKSWSFNNPTYYKFSTKFLFPGTNTPNGISMKLTLPDTTPKVSEISGEYRIIDNAGGPYVVGYSQPFDFPVVNNSIDQMIIAPRPTDPNNPSFPVFVITKWFTTGGSVITNDTITYNNYRNWESANFPQQYKNIKVFGDGNFTVNFAEKIYIPLRPWSSGLAVVQPISHEGLSPSGTCSYKYYYGQYCYLCDPGPGQYPTQPYNYKVSPSQAGQIVQNDVLYETQSYSKAMAAPCQINSCGSSERYIVKRHYIFNSTEYTDPRTCPLTP